MFDNLHVERSVVKTNEDEVFKPHTTRLNVLIIFIAGMGSYTFGYANNAIAGTLAQTSFLERFLTGANADSLIGGILGGFLGGGFIGSIVQAPISKKYGRRVCSASAAAIITVSAAILAGSVHIAMFITGRVLCGIGAGMVLSNVPVYMSEISPPHTRGMLSAMHAFILVLGYIVSSVLAFGFYFIKKDYAWRLQFVMLTFFSLLLGVSLMFIPESPRWLVEQGRDDEAWKILERIHRSKDDVNDTLARAEMLQIQAQISVEKSLPISYLHILKTKSLRKRAFCSMLVWLTGQSTGILVIANLTPTLFGALGYSTVLQLGLSIVWVTVAGIGCLINAALIDRVGRVKLLVLAGYLCSTTLIIEAVLQKYFIGSTNTAGLSGAVAMYFLFILFYGSTIDCTAYVYIAEIWPTPYRSHGVTFGGIAFFGSAIAYNSPASLAFAEIGYKYYFVFVAVCLTGATAMAFILPETSGVTLEEIGARFGDKVGLEFHDMQVMNEDPKGNAEVAEVTHVERKN